MIALDTLSALHMPCYGYSRQTAPKLCEYANNNILFTRAYSHSPMSLQSHFSVITSLYPFQHRITEAFAEAALDDRYKTLAQVLQSNGYSTIYNAPLHDPHYPLNRGAERGYSIIEQRDDSKLDIDEWEKSIQKFKQNMKSNKPTFLFLQSYYMHDPYLTGHTNHPFTNLHEYPDIPLTPQEFTKLSIEYFNYCPGYALKDASTKGVLSDDVIQKLNFLKTSHDFGAAYNVYIKLPRPIQTGCLKDWYIKRINLNNPQEKSYFEALYDEQILHMDEKLSKFLAFLSEPDVAKSTIVVFDGVHGEEFMEHGEWGHSNNLYLTSIQVPLIMHVPGMYNKVVKDIVQGIDIYPTILSLLGIKPVSKIQGIDLTGLIEGRINAQKNKFVLSEWKGKSAIQTTEWRLYYDKNKKPLELYNLLKDPGEQSNILLKNQNIAKQLLQMAPN